jgi:uncharacterized membrane protein YfcA
VDLASIGLMPVVIILVTIAIGAIMKGITGLGLPLFAVPALAMFVPVDVAVIIMALPSLVANSWLIIIHRKYLPLMRPHRLFLGLGFVGALAGTWFLANFDDAVLRILLASWLGIYLIQHFTGEGRSTVFGGKAGLAGPLGFAAGTFQGATGISAPVIAPYYHAHGLTLSAYAFAVACTFALLSVGQLSAMVTVDLLTPALIGYGLLATITTMSFMQIGVRLARHLTREIFDRGLPIVFILIEAKLIYDIVSKNLNS